MMKAIGYDPDLVITSGLMAAEKEIDALRAEIARVQARPPRTMGDVG